MKDPKSEEDRARPEGELRPDRWDLDEREAAGAVRFTLVGEQWQRRKPRTPPVE